MAKAAEWTKRVAAWRASGLGAAEFCAAHDYSVKSLWHWSSKLGRSSAGNQDSSPKQQPAVRLARVKRSTSSMVSAEHSSMLVEIDGARLTLRGRVDETALRAVVAVLRDASQESSQ